MWREKNNQDSPALPFIKTMKIRSFGEFVEVIQGKLSCGHWLYRGLKDTSFELVPTLARLEHSGDELYEYEMIMLRKTFASSTDQDTSAHSDINQLLLAQHHGAPTRLLDWTSSALVAAYFASEALDEKKDFKIVAVHVCPQSAGLTHFSVNDLRSVDFYKGYFDTDRAKVEIDNQRPSLRDGLSKKGTIFVQGSDISPRVAAQQGYVSIQRFISTPLDQQMSEDITYVVHIEVDSSLRENFQNTLYQLGVRRRSLFPDVDALFGGYTKEKAIYDRLCESCSTDAL